jgi:3D (Asp-Asp-Asp) domain-containing protein
VHQFGVTIFVPVVRRALILAVALAILVLPSTSGADSIRGLRASQSALAARERAAVLQLYAIDSGLDRARSGLAAAEGRLAAARRRQSVARLQLRVARRTLALAQSHLAAQLRALYEHGSPDVLAVIFGATSLDEVISGLDGLSRVSTATSGVIEQTRRARGDVTRILATLDRRAARLARLRATAASRAAALESARNERSSYIASLRTQRQLNGRRIATLESRARAAEAAATVVTVRAQAAGSLSALAPAPAPAPAPSVQAARASVQPGSGAGQTLTVVATAYSLHGGTASGLPTGPGVVAVDPTVIPLGTRLFIPGYGPGIAADTGTAIKGLRIDLWFPTLSQAEHWGRRTVTITVR